MTREADLAAIRHEAEVGGVAVVFFELEDGSWTVSHDEIARVAERYGEEAKRLVMLALDKMAISRHGNEEGTRQ